MVSWCFYPFGSRFLSICHFHPWIFAPCYKLNFVPLKRYVEVFLPLEPVNVTLFGSRVFAGIIELRCGHTGLGWALNSVSLEKEMATHSSILAWRTPWTEELGGLQSTGHKESVMTERLHFHFNSVWLVFLWEEKGHRNRQGKTLCDDGDWNHVIYKASDANDRQQPPEIRREAWNRFSLRASGRDHPCWYLDLRLLASRTEIMYFCCFKPSGLWQFVTVTLGHKHTPLCVSSPWEF